MERHDLCRRAEAPALRLHAMRRSEREGDADLPARTRNAGIWAVGHARGQCPHMNAVLASRKLA